MTFFLGLLSILMMTIFPGAMALKLLKPKTPLDPCLQVICIFALSLIFNLILVVGLTMLHQYRTPILRNLCAFECLAIALLYQDLWEKKLDWQAGLKWLQTYPFQKKPLQSLALIVSLLFILNWFSSFGQPFGYWDATVSYNRWATDFAANQLPTLTWHYPQLLPANWSLTYVLIGPLVQNVQLQFFPAAIQGFFFVGILLLFWVLYRQKQDGAYLSGLLLMMAAFSCFYAVYLNVGYADIPVAFFNFAALVCSILAYAEDTPNRKRLLIISLLFAFGAAMTKPAGIYTALVLPLIHEYLDPHPASFSQKCVRLTSKFVFLAALISPWYIYSSLYESNTGSFSDVSFLTRHVASAHFTQRVYDAVMEAYPLVILMGIAWILRASIPRTWRLIFYAYLPYFILWSIGFSYDNRNIILFWPIACLSVALALSGEQNLLKILTGLRLWKQPLRLWMLLFSSLVILAFYCMSGPLGEMNLITHQETEKNYSLQDIPLTTRLYAYKLCPGFHGQILTDYAYFNYLPLLQSNMNIPPLASYNKNMEPGYFDNLPAFLAYMKAHSDIHYLLLNHYFDDLYESPLWQQYFKAWLREKKLSVAFTAGNVALYTINVSNDQLADIASAKRSVTS